jgi:tetratricopeptide (TPR) repeat protein
MQVDGNYREARQKLYALLIARADRLLAAGEREPAVATLQRALELNPDGGEARQRLVALTPTATAAPAPAAPAPAPVAPRAAPAQPAPAKPAPAPAKPAPAPAQSAPAPAQPAPAPAQQPSGSGSSPPPPPPLRP